MMKNIILLFLIGITSFVFSQTSYSLEQFNKHSDFYTAFNVGSGSVNSSTNTTDFISGTASLQLTYNLPPADGSYFSSLKNYNTSTQDWGTQLDSICVRIKGGNSNTSFTVRLYEDINKNGQFDGTDEIYYTTLQVINDPSFSLYSFPISTVKKLTGNGNSTLDLNRIRAWDIAFQNDDVIASNAGTVYIDELILKTSYTPPTSGNGKLAGSFIQLWNTVGCKCGQYTLQQWKSELQQMKDLCLDNIYIQYSVYDNLSWYTPSAVSGVQTNYDALNKLFTAAEEKGMKIYLGLYFDETWNSANKALSSTYSTLLSKQQSTIDELWNLFGASPAFEGWYIPQEINDLEWKGTTEKNLLFNHLNDVSSYAKQKNSNKHVMIAPFFNLWMTSDELASWYGELFTTAPNIDQVYFQDGVGITLKDSEFHLPIYYPVLKTVCDNHNVDFGVTAESFQQLTGWPIDGGNFSATSSDINRLKKQLWAAEKFQASEIIQFSWAYMQNGNSTASSQLHLDYKNYANCLTVNTFQETDNYKTLAFPNPTNSVVFFNEKYLKIEIYDQLGALVSVKNNLSELDVMNFPSGTYFLKLYNSDEVVETKIIVSTK